MKIGYLFSRYPVPSQTFCDTEMRALEKRGCAIEIYSCSPPATSFRHDAGGRPRAPVFYAPPRHGLELGRMAAIAGGAWPAALIAEHAARFGDRYEPARRALHAVAFAERMQRRGIEHIHVHFANRATHAALFLRALTGIPFSFTAHAQDFLVDLGSDDLLREMCSQAAFVIAVSDYSRRALLDKCPDAVGKLHRIYNGLPLDRWPLPESRGRQASPTLRIFSAGRLIDFKGFDDLIAACALLRNRGTPFRCEIAGEGPAHRSLQEQISGLDLDGQVRLLGLVPQAEIRTRLAGSDIFALASRIDANGACDVLPTVILEAMAAGRPVISTRLGGIPEIVADGETGRLVNPGDPAGLADALARLGSDVLRRDQFGEAGRVRLENHFSAEHASGQLSALFAASRRAGRPAESKAEAGLLLMLDVWPAPPAFSPPCDELPGLGPSTRLLALQAGASPSDQAALTLLPRVDFLPDAIVLEGEWRESAGEAHRLEAWRSELGASVETDQFLLAARRAWYLHCRWQREPLLVGHVHAIGPAALLCAWLLIRLDPTRRGSFLVPAAPAGALPASVLRRLAPAFVGGWLPGATRLAAELGTAFYGEEVSPEGWRRWLNHLVGWAAPPPV